MTLSCLQVLSGNVSERDWNKLQYYSRKVKLFILANDTDDSRVHLSTYFRISQLQSSESALFPYLRHFHYNLANRSIPPSHIFLFLSPLLHSLTLHNFGGIENTIVVPFLTFLATLSSQTLSRIVLRSGRISGDSLKNSIVHFKQLRFLELSDAVFMSDFTLWEVLGTLPSLADMTLKATDPASYPTYDAEISNHQSGPKYFEALHSLCITGSFLFIQHLLGLIDSPCLTTIKIYPLINNEREDEPDNRFTPSMTIITSKWPQSLKNFVIDSRSGDPALRDYPISECLMSLTVLYELRSFRLIWMMKNTDDNVRRLVMSWPKLKTLRLPLQNTSSISLSTLRIIAESCPELHHLTTRLDTSTFPPFDTSSKSLHHNLKVLEVRRVHTPIAETNLASQIRVAQHLDSIFPYLESIEVGTKAPDATWSGIRDLVFLCQAAGLRRIKREATTDSDMI